MFGWPDFHITYHYRFWTKKLIMSKFGGMEIFKRGFFRRYLIFVRNWINPRRAGKHVPFLWKTIKKH